MPARSQAHLALGDAIRELRAEAGLSQERLALEADLDRSYTGAVERGERNIAFENLIRIAGALSVPGSELLARAESHGAGVKTLPMKKQRPRNAPGSRQSRKAAQLDPS